MHRPVVAIDVGGTFTDCVAWGPSGVVIAKIPSTSDQSEAVLTGTGRLAPNGAAALLHGSTVATNTLLQRQGADTVLITDPGFEDVIEIGRQDRPSLYDSFADRPPPLVGRDDRFGSFDPAEVLDWVGQRRAEAIAVCLAYSFADPGTEREIMAALEPTGAAVSVSHLVSAEFREFERTSTTVLNAYLSPSVGGYLSRLAERASAVTDAVQVMRSSGGLMDVAEAADLAAALLLSGPAGGVVAASELGRVRGISRLISFDMGGTSTDVCRIENGRPEVLYERAIDGYICRLPSVAVHTVGAGGGSIAWVDPGGSLRVGPQSAGAMPGPVAYGRGGTEVTVTDAHLVLGHLDPDLRLGDTLDLDVDAASAAMERLGQRLGLDRTSTASGIIEVVEAHMERAIRSVSVEQGADPRQAALVAFGGAGGLHATTLARRLGMSSVLIPPHAGVLSALGLLMAPPRLDRARSVPGLPLDRVGGAARELGSAIGEEFVRRHGTRALVKEFLVDLRYVGQAHEIAVPFEPGEDPEALTRRFHRLHRELNGFSRPDDPIEVVTVRAVAEGTPLMRWEDMVGPGEKPSPRPGSRSIVMPEGDLHADVWWRHDLGAGFVFEGPAVVEEEAGTSVFVEGDRVEVGPDGTLEVTFK